MRTHENPAYVVFEENGSGLEVFRIKISDPPVVQKNETGRLILTEKREFAYIFFRKEPKHLSSLIREAKDYVLDNWDDVYFLVEMDKSIQDTSGIREILSGEGFIPITHDAEGQTRRMWARGNK